jgi:hypothetical protein
VGNTTIKIVTKAVRISICVPVPYIPNIKNTNPIKDMMISVK